MACLIAGTIDGAHADIGADSSKASKMEFHIDAQPMSSALTTLGAQSGLTIIVETKVSSGLTAVAVSGSYTAEEALRKLLEPAGLRADYLDSKTVAVRSATATSLSREGLGTEGVESGMLRLAQTGVEGTHAPQAADAKKEDLLEEIVVTAQKREERLQDVPISMSVLGGDQLDRATFRGTTEALGSMPGVVATVANQTGGSQVAIRGVAALSPILAGSSPIAYYVDASPFGLVKAAIAPDLNAYDMERVEVLRGPQGTLYGASALNGVVRILTKDANLNELEFKARTSASSTSGGGENYRGDLAVNVPLIEGKLAARAVLGYEDLDGWIERPNKSDVNDAELSNARLKVNAQPTERLSLGWSAWLSRTDFGGPSAADNNGVRNGLLDEPIAIDYDAFGFRIGYDFPGISLASMSSYLDYSNDGVKRSAFSTTMLRTFYKSEVFTQELNLTSTGESVWQWSAGAIYRDGKDRVFQNAATFVAPTDFADLSESFAVFGELRRLFAGGRFELTGGLRYFEDDVTNKENTRHTGVLTEPLYYANETFDKVTPRVVLNWHPNPDLTAYVSYAEGFRSGFNQTANVARVAPGFPPVKPDSLSNYEFGAKGNLWDDRLSFDTAIYYIDWRDVQQSLSIPFNNTIASALINSGPASGVGFEFAVTMEPVERLQLGVNVGWNNLELEDDVNNFVPAPAGSPPGTPPVPVVLFTAGERLNLSPETTAGVSLDYGFPLGDILHGRFSASANYHTKQSFRTIISGRTVVDTSDSILIGRAAFAVDAGVRWTATLFVDNLNDEDGAETRLLSTAGNSDESARIRPRTVGLQFEYRVQ